MEYSSSRSPSPATIHRRSLVHELQRGHRAAEQLRRRLIRDPLVEDPAPVLSDIDLAEAILNSFNNSLSIATNSDPSVISSRLRFDDCKIEDSGSGDGGGKSLRIRDRRGCYKRRKRGQSWTADADVPAEDCYAWRKYGQKMILNAKFPRNYYRCTHKTDQGCLAIKQVQKISEDPPLYRTTYNGQHTCKNPLKTPQIIIPSSSSSPGQSDSSILLSFDTSYNNINSPFFPPSNNNSMPIKQELPTNTATHAMMNVMMMAMNQSSPSDYNYLSSSDPTTVGSDLAGDVISAGTYPGSASPNSLEIDNYINHLDFIQFDCDINV